MDTKNRLTDRSLLRQEPFLARDRSKQAKKEIDTFLDGKMDEWNATVPFARHLEGSDVHLPYYKQTLIEHAWRIRLSRTVQCNTLHKISRVNAKAAKLYAAYQDDEMLHDALFMRDAEKVGITARQILETEPNFYTRLLIGYLYFVAEHEKPLGVICYSYLVEYTTRKITPKQIEAMTTSLGKDMIAGQVAHLKTDIREDHTEDMWDLLSLLIESDQDIIDIKRYMTEIQELLAKFFIDLYERYGAVEVLQKA